MQADMFETNKKEVRTNIILHSFTFKNLILHCSLLRFTRYGIIWLNRYFYTKLL